VDPLTLAYRVLNVSPKSVCGVTIWTLWLKPCYLMYLNRFMSFVVEMMPQNDGI